MFQFSGNSSQPDLQQATTSLLEPERPFPNFFDWRAVTIALIGASLYVIAGVYLGWIP